MSKTFLPMMLTVFASVGTYYLLVTETGLSENLSMAGGVIVAILLAVATRKLFDRKK
ncbi:hypothetical protein SAMN05660706_12629 [Desulfoscipio geothermicus DSM 3669]|uniref:Uncharacterized protein n=1 Tax=Desulfoscipio geothermicus DSM 3669 TaxID=1121426 RepID=A0A1I6E5A0_9FIRM|nr:hypothetical protein SAMN05660706_12629 [Desulfoscipio geothermicus DSM 3669]